MHTHDEAHFIYIIMYELLYKNIFILFFYIFNSIIFKFLKPVFPIYLYNNNNNYNFFFSFFKFSIDNFEHWYLQIGLSL